MSREPAAAFDSAGKDYPCGFLGRGSLPALREVSFCVQPGEVFGLVGPNRAGKTTLVKLLLALARPTAGRVFRLGQPAADRSTLARIGYVHESHAFPPHLSARELLAFYGAFTLLPARQVRARIPILLERVGLADRADEPIARFSKGMAQRLALAQALLNDPDLLVLDEPGEGLDLDGRGLVRAVILEQQRRGATVLLISHQLTDVQELCGRVGVMRAGRLIYLGAVAELCTDAATGAVRPLAEVLPALHENPAHASGPVADPAVLADPRHLSPGGGLGPDAGADGGHPAVHPLLPGGQP